MDTQQPTRCQTTIRRHGEITQPLVQQECDQIIAFLAHEFSTRCHQRDWASPEALADGLAISYPAAYHLLDGSARLDDYITYLLKLGCELQFTIY